MANIAILSDAHLLMQAQRYGDEKHISPGQFSKKENRRSKMAEVSNVEAYLKELADGTEDQIHKRLIAAYKGNNPKEQIEKEFGNILSEVISHED